MGRFHIINRSEQNQQILLNVSKINYVDDDEVIIVGDQSVRIDATERDAVMEAVAEWTGGGGGDRYQEGYDDGYEVGFTAGEAYGDPVFVEEGSGNVWTGTQDEYDAITEKSENVIYLIEE